MGRRVLWAKVEVDRFDLLTVIVSSTMGLSILKDTSIQGVLCQYYL